MRGDGPCKLSARAARRKFPPHARGWTGFGAGRSRAGLRTILQDDEYEEDDHHDDVKHCGCSFLSGALGAGRSWPRGDSVGYSIADSPVLSLVRQMAQRAQRRILSSPSTAGRRPGSRLCGLMTSTSLRIARAGRRPLQNRARVLWLIPEHERPDTGVGLRAEDGADVSPARAGMDRGSRH